MSYTCVNTNWALHVIDDEPLPQSIVQQSQKLFFAKKIKPDKKGEKTI